MVSSRLTSFVFVLVFIVYESSADIHQVTAEKIDDVAARKSFTVDCGSPAPVRKDIIDAVPTPRESSNLILGGRKKMKRRFLTRKTLEKKDTMVNLEATKFSGATDFNDEQSVNYQHVKRDDLSSFVALNADYHPPKSHPPKNN